MKDPRVQKALDFDEECGLLRAFLSSDKHTVMVLATSSKDRVLARNVLIAADDLDLYGFTWKHSRKCAQIEANPRVALCVDTLQLEGRAELLGPLTNPETPGVTVMRERFPDAVEQWALRPGMIVFRVRPTLVVLAEPVDGKPALHFIDFEKREAYGELWADG